MLDGTCDGAVGAAILTLAMQFSSRMPLRNVAIGGVVVGAMAMLSAFLLNVLLRGVLKYEVGALGAIVVGVAGLGVSLVVDYVLLKTLFQTMIRKLVATLNSSSSPALLSK